jgi:hypothetical protein
MNMGTAFPATAAETYQLARSLVLHLKRSVRDTKQQEEWTSMNLESLRLFADHGYELKHYPPDSTSNQKGAFLWDYIAYQQGTGILIAAESEHRNKGTSLREDFEKLFYVHAPIKVFLFLEGKNADLINGHVKDLRDYMSACCSRFTAGDVFILYCRTWSDGNDNNEDQAFLLQVPGRQSNFCELAPEDDFKPMFDFNLFD